MDGDTLTYWVEIKHPGVIGRSFSGSELSLTALNPARTNVTYGVSDGYGGYVSHTGFVTGAGSVTLEVAESAAGGTNVGDAITGTPYSNEYMGYGFTGEAVTTGAFVIDSSNGQISVKQGATLDYETKSSYTGEVEWLMHSSWEENARATVAVTINVTNVGADQPDAPTVTRTKFAEQSAPALDITWTASAANGATITGYNLQYRKKATQGLSAAWTDYTVSDGNGGTTTTLPATTTAVNLADPEAGPPTISRCGRRPAPTRLVGRTQAPARKSARAGQPAAHCHQPVPPYAPQCRGGERHVP